MWPAIGLVIIVAAVLIVSRQPLLQPVFRWLPLPLWCYLLPMLAVAAGWLPAEQPGQPLYRTLTNLLLPFALGLLLLGVNLPAIMNTGLQAVAAALVGAIAIVCAAPVGAWLLQRQLPPDAWKGIGALAGTWTGGTMNLLALRSVLETPEAIFAPLIVVDALIAYGWMALLIGISGAQAPINRWLRAPAAAPHADMERVVRALKPPRGAVVLGALLALGLAASAGGLAGRLPTSQLVNSSSGWTVLLVTTGALALSFAPAIRRIGAAAGLLGYPCLYVVLAATGAQASLRALWSAPVWLLVGVWVVLAHGGALLLAGRLLRIPLGTLATASQANLGGVVSAPMVGAVYHQSLVPVGLLLAMVGNAVGTYLGLFSAALCRWLL